MKSIARVHHTLLVACPWRMGPAGIAAEGTEDTKKIQGFRDFVFSWQATTGSDFSVDAPLEQYADQLLHQFFR